MDLVGFGLVADIAVEVGDFVNFLFAAAEWVQGVHIAENPGPCCIHCCRNGLGLNRIDYRVGRYGPVEADHLC